MVGSQIGVFKHDDDDQLEYVNKIPVVKDLAGEIFSPAKAMLHQRDSKMLLLDPAKEDTVFCMDLERGQVIEEWVCAFRLCALPFLVRSLVAVQLFDRRSDVCDLV